MSKKRSPAKLETRDILGLEVLATGTFWGQGSPPEGDTFTEADLDLMVEAAAALPLKRPAKLGHNNEQAIIASDGLPAVGWLENVRRVGEKLLADVLNIPAKLADIIEAGGYRQRSAELRFNYRDSDGKVWPKVLTGMAFLGADIPACASLDDIVALYGAADEAELRAYEFEPAEGDTRSYAVKLPITLEGSYEWVRGLIRDALPAGDPDSDWYVEITQPDVVLVSHYSDDAIQYFAVEYEIEDGKAILAPRYEWVEVEREEVFDEAKTYAEQRRDERATERLSDAGTKDIEGSPATESTDVTEDAMNEAICLALGLAEDATEEDILARIAELQAEPTQDLKNYVAKDSEEYRALHSRAEASEAKLFRMERDKVLDAAMAAEKFTPDKLEEWETRYARDPEMTAAILAEIEPSTLVLSGEGHPTSTPDLSDRKAVHEEARAYQEEHPGTSYEDALARVLR